MIVLRVFVALVGLRESGHDHCGRIRLIDWGSGLDASDSSHDSIIASGGWRSKRAATPTMRIGQCGQEQWILRFAQDDRWRLQRAVVRWKLRAQLKLRP